MSNRRGRSAGCARNPVNARSVSWGRGRLARCSLGRCSSHRLGCPTLRCRARAAGGPPALPAMRNPTSKDSVLGGYPGGTKLVGGMSCCCRRAASRRVGTCGAWCGRSGAVEVDLDRMQAGVRLRSAMPAGCSGASGRRRTAAGRRAGPVRTAADRFESVVAGGVDAQRAAPGGGERHAHEQIAVAARSGPRWRRR